MDVLVELKGIFNAGTEHGFANAAKHVQCDRIHLSNDVFWDSISSCIPAFGNLPGDDLVAAGRPGTKNVAPRLIMTVQFSESEPSGRC